MLSPCIYAVFLAGILGTGLYHSLHGWSFSVGGPHEFRQAQTAIASHYIAQEGLTVATKIPVLGPDWIIPFEFPLYQNIVGTLHRLTGIPLEPCGRAVSLLAFYLSLLPLAALLRRLQFGRDWTLMTLALVASSPVYVFWSRTFLIESTALLLALGFAASVLKLIDEPQGRHVLFCLLPGVAAALTKFTTFSIVFGFLVLWVFSLHLLHRDHRVFSPGVRTRLALVMAVPVFAGYGWSLYVSHIWGQSPLTQVFSETIHTWNFGTLEQRVSVQFWAQFIRYAVNTPASSFVPWLAGFVAFAFATFRWRVTALCAFGAWISGPLVWANLFYVHDYYHYSTSLFGFMWMTASMIGVSERWPLLRFPVQAAVAALCLALILTYRTHHYYEATLIDRGHEKKAFAASLGEVVPEDDVVIILGDDWNPMISYYSMRKSIMIRWDDETQGDAFNEALRLSLDEGREIAGVVTTAYRPMPGDFDRLSRQLNLPETPTAASAENTFQFYPSRATE